MDFLSQLEQYFSKNLLSKKYHTLFHRFYLGYKEALQKDHIDIKPYEPLLIQFLHLAKEQIEKPFRFEPYHKQVLSPVNHYRFGVEFVRPLIDMNRSSLQGEAYLQEISEKLKNQENVVFLANHQVEADPQAISILLEKNYPELAQNTIFVAGERVIIDPFAIPFSMGCNLLCIYSKRYIDHPAELKTKKQLHNKKTMELMSELLCEGGHSIYVAPSGGRDRINNKGEINVSPFDPSSIELFYLMAQKASKPTSFYPMALYTYDLLPPPDDIQIEIGEERKTKRCGIHLSIGPCLSMENILGPPELDKKKRREFRAEFIWAEVCKLYKEFPHTKKS